MHEPTLLLDLQITVAAWRRVPRLRARLKAAAQATLNHLPARRRGNARATILLTSDTIVRRLNHDFRGKDLPTNVLSFPQFSAKDLRALSAATEPVELGDIALAYRTVAGEAKTEGKLLIDHITHLVIHGLLHLFGYDHLSDREADQMEKMEIAIMKALDLPDPYAPLPPKPTKRRQ